MRLEMELFFSTDEGYGNVVGMGKNMWQLYVRFFNAIKSKKSQVKTVPGDPKTHYLGFSPCKAEQPLRGM